MVGDVEVKTEKGVLILTINRVSKKNALCEDMYSVFADAFEQLGRDETIRCMLIKANGDSFCAGNDISFFLNNYSIVPDAPVGRFLYGLIALTKPLVAAVQGMAVGNRTYSLAPLRPCFRGGGHSFVGALCQLRIGARGRVEPATTRFDRSSKDNGDIPARQGYKCE